MVHPRKRFALGLDLAFLKEHRRDKPLLSMWTHIFKPLGHAIAAFIVGDLQLDVEVPVEDLRPNPTYAHITFAAVNDIRLCEMLFDKWTTELDKCVANRLSQPRVATNDNDWFTGSGPRSQAVESKCWDSILGS
jgi:hypothetical protein